MPENSEAPIPFYSNGGIELYQGNCAEIIPHLKNIDLVITDPPWQLHGYTKRIEDAEKVGDEQEAKWFKTMWSWYASWMILLKQAGIERGWFFIGHHHISPFLRVADVLRMQVQHIFVNPGNEFLLYFGGEPIANCWIKGFDRHFRGLPYSNRKDPELIKKLIFWAGLPSSILDPFVGEGSTLVAAREFAVRAVGIEIRKEYAENAIKKIGGGCH